MARYILVHVEDNDRADKLIEKLNPVSGVEVVGLFAQPKTFCQCEPKSETSLLGGKYGWRICPVCRRAKPTQHAPKNLLDLEGSHPGTHRWHLLTWEPEAWRQK